MMQIGSTLPAQNLHGLFQMRRSTSRCSGSPLNPSNNEMTKKHLSNLQKLLHVPSDTDPSESEPKARIQLEGLNLSRAFWPEAKSAEDMSPRHLNRLQRLLSKSPDHSPRNNLGSRWRDYHGRNDWAGLVDPLDENLRREVVRFGEFVQAAYHCFHSNPAMSDDDPGFPRHVAVPDRSYKVTKSLYATSGVGLPKWVDDVAPELGWITQRSSWVGYVAVCDDRDEIRRMGRRDIVIALRGTATCLEWAENVRDVLVPLSSDDEDVGGTNGDDDDDHHSAVTQVPKVECGFLSLFKTRGHEHNIPSLAESVVSEIQRLVEKYKGETLSISITGHSLGAALALLAGDAISTACGPSVPPVAVFSFGGPRVGNRGFADRLGSNGVKVLRVVNSQDVITRVPGMFVSEDLDRKVRGSTIGKRVLDAVDGFMPWAYAHVGTELRVDTKMSPFLKPDADMACCHDLEAYLHLVDGFLSSSCPFRPNAKRSLWRLLHEQRSNFKRLYTSKSNKAAAAGLRLGEIERDHRHLLVPSSCLPSPSS